MTVINSSNIRTVENYIHFLLEKYNVKDEVFRINVDEAIIIIKHVIKSLISMCILTCNEGEFLPCASKVPPVVHHGSAQLFLVFIA